MSDEINKVLQDNLDRANKIIEGLEKQRNSSNNEATSLYAELQIMIDKMKVQNVKIAELEKEASLKSVTSDTKEASENK